MRKSLYQLFLREIKAWVWAGLAITVFFLAVPWYIDEVTFSLRGPTVTTKGSIVEIISDDGACQLSISFFTANQKVFKLKPPAYSSFDCSRHVGDLVDVVYRSTNPQDARFIPPGGAWISYLWTPVVATCFSSAFFALFLSHFLGELGFRWPKTKESQTSP